jgi:nitronate monooxygenase
MSIETSVTKLLGVRHPVLLAPMDLVSDARLTAAVSAAGGFGILGGGYGERELGRGRAPARSGAAVAG